MITAYKLLRRRKDGTLGPLFINRRQVVPVGVWLEAEDHPTKGFAHRPGWHCTLERSAPHLKMRLKNGEQRVWCKVLVKDIKLYDRPESQGGSWVLADHMIIVEVCNDP
jgi:hypothetical protein